MYTCSCSGSTSRLMNHYINQCTQGSPIVYSHSNLPLQNHWFAFFLEHLRALIGKIKQYCLRFRSVLCRSWKYDAEVTEYFVQTSDTVRIKRSDLEKFEKSEDLDETEDMPAIKPKALMDTAVKAIEDKKDGSKNPAAEINTQAECSENLAKFLDSLHRKASQATTWISSLEPPTLPNPNSRQKQYLGLKSYFLKLPPLKVINIEEPSVLKPEIFVGGQGDLCLACLPPRFVEDVRKILAALETSFLGLAECQHILETEGCVPDFQTKLAKAKEVARNPWLHEN